MPPTPGAFCKHLERTHLQLNIWANANLSMIPYFEPKDKGWEESDEGYAAVTTEELIAPVSMIELVSCKCKKGCKETRFCACKRSGENCTDFCGCCEHGCENTDGVHADLYNTIYISI